jgi:branched-chain amino acid transport system ATP-binding protein
MLRPLWTYREHYARADGALETVGLAERRDELVRNLSHGEQRQVEIALALLGGPRVLLLDEPTAGLSPAESARLTRAIQQLDADITVLRIEHDMDVVFDIVSRITVLHQGRPFADGTPAEIRKDPRVQKIYFGEQ